MDSNRRGVSIRIVNPTAFVSTMIVGYASYVKLLLF